MTLTFRPLEDSEIDAYFDVMELAFGIELPATQRERSRQVVDVQRMRTAVDHGQLVATFNAFPIQMAVPGNVIPLSGVSQVTVAPTHRRRGILTRLMHSHFNEARDRGDLMAGLWASESHIYGRFGFGIASHRHVTKIAKPYAKLTSVEQTAISQHNEKIEMVSQSDALHIFPTIYDRVAQGVPGMLSRTSAWWSTRILADPPENRHGATPFRHALLQQNDQPVGYAIYYHRLPNGYGSLEAHLVELLAIDSAAELELWNYVLTLDLTVSLSYWNQPVDCVVVNRTVESRRWERSTVDSLWLRPVDLTAALSARSYAHHGELVLEFDDDACPWNKGRFLLSVDEAGHGRCQATTRTPHLKLTPATIGSLYLSGTSAYELWRCGQLWGNEPHVILADRMFGWHRKPWCPHIF